MTITETVTDDLLRDLVACAPDAVVVVDAAGVIRLWNAAAEDTFGHQAGDAVGQTLDLIVPERWRERHWDGFRRAIASGATTPGRDLLAVPAMRADGAQISIEFTVTPLRDSDGAVSAVAAIVRDVSARFDHDRALRRRVAELERDLELRG